MKSKVTIFAVSAAALVVVGAGAVYAHGGRGGPGFMKWGFEHRISEAEDYVDATPDQRKVIEGARDAIEAKMQARFDARKAEREAGKPPPADPHDLVRMLAADKIDEQALYAAIDARADEMKAMARQIVPEVIKAHDALTSAQRQKLAARAEQRHAEMKARWEERRKAGDDGRGFGGPDHGGFGGPDGQ